MLPLAVLAGMVALAAMSRLADWHLPDGVLRRPSVMGILNVTPDSFSDGGAHDGVIEAVRAARAMVDEGADLLDIGGESSRPGAEPVSVEQELRRVVPVLEALAGRIGVPVSIDTTKPEVARRAIALGASVVNDIGGLQGDDALARVVAESGAGVVLMHMLGTPRDMQNHPSYVDVVLEVFEGLARRVERAERFGIARERIAIDPGIGFGKTSEHNRALIRSIGRFRGLGCAVLVGTSRKRFLGDLTGRDVSGRMTASVISSLAAIEAGADVVRVHDVGPMTDALKVWTALRGVRAFD